MRSVFLQNFNLLSIFIQIASLEKTIKDLNETLNEKEKKIDSLEGNLSKEQRNHRGVLYFYLISYSYSQAIAHAMQLISTF